MNGVAASAAGTTSTTTGSDRPDRDPHRLRRSAVDQPRPGLAASVLTIQSETLANAVCGAPGSGGPYTTATVDHRHQRPGADAGLLLRLHAHRHRPGRQHREHQHHGHRRRARASRTSRARTAAPPSGKPEAGDTISVTFNTPLDPSTVPATGTITLCNNLAGCSASTHTLITISGLSSSAGFNVANGLREERLQPDRRRHVHPERRSPDRDVHDHRHSRREREDRRHDVDVQLRTLDDAARPERERRQRDLRHPDGAHALLIHPQGRDGLLRRPVTRTRRQRPPLNFLPT